MRWLRQPSLQTTKIWLTREKKEKQDCAFRARERTEMRKRSWGQLSQNVRETSKTAHSPPFGNVSQRFFSVSDSKSDTSLRAFDHPDSFYRGKLPNLPRFCAKIGTEDYIWDSPATITNLRCEPCEQHVVADLEKPISSLLSSHSASLLMCQLHCVSSIVRWAILEVRRFWVV